jgi:hypothetical protein
MERVDKLGLTLVSDYLVFLFLCYEDGETLHPSYSLARCIVVSFYFKMKCFSNCEEKVFFILMNGPSQIGLTFKLPKKMILLYNKSLGRRKE